MLAPHRNLEAALRGLRSMARVYYDAEPPAESQRKNGMGEFSIRMRFWPVGRFGLAGQIPSRIDFISRGRRDPPARARLGCHRAVGQR